MATQKETVAFPLQKLRPSERFSARPMFGEYALYAEGKVVAVVCDDLLYVKILPASQELESQCERGEPYPGAKPHYIVDEGQLTSMAKSFRYSLRSPSLFQQRKRKLDKGVEVERAVAQQLEDYSVDFSQLFPDLHVTQSET